MTIPPERFNDLLRNNTIKSAAEILGVAPDTLYSFFSKHPERRPSFLPPASGSRYDQYREKITALLEETKNVSHAAHRLGLSASSLWSYLKRRPELFPADFPEPEKGPHLDRIAPGTITELLRKHRPKEAAERLDVSERTLSKYLKLYPELKPERRYRK